MHAPLALALCVGLAAQTPQLAAPDLPSLFVVDAPTPGQRLLLHRLFDLPGACCGAPATAGPLEVIVQEQEVAALRAIAPAARFVRSSRPFAEIEAERALAAGGDVPDAGYYTVAEVEAAIDAAVAAHPAFARKVDVSALPGGVPSIEGRHVFALKVSDNPAADEDEPAILLAAQHHAREVNSTVMVIGAMQRVLAARAAGDPQMAALVDGNELWFVPMVNPDGVAHVWNVADMWRKNRRVNGTSFGVDLNRNYPFLWGLCGASTSPSSDTYRGTAPASEPEVQLMRNLVAFLRPEVYLDFHSYGQQVLRIWAPCATVHPAMDAFQVRYADDLRAPMTYGTRDPSASGEAPEDHYSSGGTLAYLIEVGTSFQPPYATTVTEEARVWPGVQHALLGWRPALRGHVRSSLGRAPLAATITFAPSPMNHGEVTKSRARDGRYGLWLPLGTWDVTFAAAGHASRTRTVTVTAYDAPVALEVELEPTAPIATIAKAGNERLGTAVTFTYTSPGDAGRTALFGWALGTSPGLDLGGLRVIPLNPDFLFEAAIAGNPILAPTWTTLDAQHRATSILAIPNDPFVLGLTTHVAGITLDFAYSTAVKTWSAPVSVTPVP